MADYQRPYTRRSSGWPGRRPPFLVMMALVCLVGFYAFGSRRLGLSRFDREQAEPGTPIMGRAWVVDGDSIRIGGVSIRLDGIDAPEWDQTCGDGKGQTWRCGLMASRQLRDQVRGREISCRPRAHDRYGRTLATCSLSNGTNLNGWLVRQGWAVATGFSSIYGAEEAEAKSERRGIWSGSFMFPWEWRQQKSARSRFRWSGWWH
jgi:endonuclease YncB( thermonuclease family)